MARRRFLIAYDVADPKRLRRVCKVMEGYGDRLQYSVFVSDLSASELIHARAEVEDEMLMTEDSVVIVDLGEVADARFLFIGRRRRLPTLGPAGDMKREPSSDSPFTRQRSRAGQRRFWRFPKPL